MIARIYKIHKYDSARLAYSDFCHTYTTCMTLFCVWVCSYSSAPLDSKLTSQHLVFFFFFCLFSFFPVVVDLAAAGGYPLLSKNASKVLK